MASNQAMKGEACLNIRTVTWLKDSHSLFDYEFNKNVTQTNFQMPLSAKYVFLYRSYATSELTIQRSDYLTPSSPSGAQILCCLELIPDGKKTKMRVHHASQLGKSENNHPASPNTEGSVQGPEKKEEDAYIIVRSLKSKNNQNKGCKLQVGQIVRLGRIQYRVTSIKTGDNQEETIKGNNPFFSNFQTTEYDQSVPKLKQEHELQCKYCLGNEEGDDGNFFISPCHCVGSSGIVHIKCLQLWIQSKVKKQVHGGTLHYNFEKFFCEICKKQFPRFIKKGDKLLELMPISKPQGSYAVLEGMTQKTNNLIVLQNPAPGGIKIGRSHDCQIRIADISVSRNHAKIEKINDQFVLFDLKSKFGTLIKEDNMTITLGSIKQAMQIGRTVITVQIPEK